MAGVCTILFLPIISHSKAGLFWYLKCENLTQRGKLLIENDLQSNLEIGGKI
jgi:hypothetical protein